MSIIQREQFLLWTPALQSHPILHFGLQERTHLGMPSFGRNVGTGLLWKLRQSFIYYLGENVISLDE